jgi:Cu/Ag efflux pump CusA
VRTVNTQIGRAVLGDEAVGINSAEILVSIDPAADYDTTIAAIGEVVDRYPGRVSNLQTYLEEKIEPVLTGARQAYAVRIYGPDIDILRSTANEIRHALSEIDGIVDLTVEPLNYEPNVEITVDVARAKQYGLIPGDVRRAAATLVAGLEVGSLFEQQKVFDVVVWSVPEARNSLTALHELLIDAPRGGPVRLGDVAELRQAPSLSTIHRDANSRRIDVGFNVSGNGLGTALGEVESRLQQIEFPVEYHPELIGGYAERRTEQNLMVGVVAAVAIGAYLLLQAAFQSWRLALLAYMTTIVALAGGLLAAYIGGGVISLGSLLGLLAVLAVALRSSTLLVNHYRHLEQEDDESFGPQLVLRGSRERLAPILMTALATGLALVPFVLYGDIPGLEIAHPMAVVVLGGVAASTLINLFVAPALFLQFGSSPEPLRATESH